LKEDGSITSYEVRSWISIEPEGCVGLLSDLINLNKFDLPTLMAEQDFVTTNDCVSCLYKSKFLQKQQKKLNSTLKHGRNAFHELCRITDDGSISDLTSGEELEELFKSSSTNHLQLTKKLRTKDQFGWTPLHYACRFRANDLKLIDALLQKCPNAFFDKDRFDRFPLHLALEGSFSPEVIKSLLKHDKENKITFATTKHLKVRKKRRMSVTFILRYN
jgi:ankyrin repeat protein